LGEVQLMLSNFSFLFCRVQLTLIYLQSGLDKLSSEVWRSGDAIFYITQLDFFFSPLLTINESSFMILAWSTILFELSFALLIWVRKFRIALLTLGVVFHLGIAIFLSLPDFGIMMILTYSLFFPFEKFYRVKKAAFGGS